MTLKRQLLLFFFLLAATLSAPASAPRHITVWTGPTPCEDWKVWSVDAIKFQNLELGDTVYVQTSNLGPYAQGALQNHEFGDIDEGVINGQTIKGDFQMIVTNERRLNELKNYGIRFSGFQMTVERILIKKHNTDKQWLAAAAVVAAIVLLLVLLLLLWHSYRRLRQANRVLYQRSLESMVQAERQRELRNRYEGQIQLLTDLIQASPALRQKYQGSTLGDDEKSALAQRIERVMDDVETVCSPDMSLNRLAELVESNYKRVSQVVNERFGCNFSSLLAERRIREACRRLCDTEQYGRLTIEAVGESLGFRSRSAFTEQFKRVTGLTPTEFVAQSQQ